MLFYLIRHCITWENQEEVFQTRDTPLSEMGFRQADKLARSLQAPIDVIITSPMTRARQTAETLGKAKHVSVIETPLLDEQRRPQQVRGLSKREAHVIDIMKQIREHASDPEWHFSDEENLWDLSNRAKLVLDLLLSGKWGSAAVVSHGELLRMLLAEIIFGDNRDPKIRSTVLETFASFNGGVSLVEHNSRGWYVKSWNVDLINMIA
jgi:broad specificity phosphatase PhoE